MRRGTHPRGTFGTPMAAVGPHARVPATLQCSFGSPVVMWVGWEATTMMRPSILVSPSRTYLRVPHFPRAPEAPDDLALVQQRQVQRELGGARSAYK